MPSWIYHDVLGFEEDQRPAFALQSTLNWARALAFEIRATHGATFADWAASFRTSLAPTVRPPATPMALSGSIEPLVSSIVAALSLGTVEQLGRTSPWIRPSAVVTWYYALYGAVRSMLASVAQPSGDDHRKTMRTFQGNLSGRMPHPLNMRARWLRNEDYEVTLPSAPGAASFDLIRGFEENSACAQGMLRQYLSGTASHYAERTKGQLAAAFPNGFRTNAARAARDARVEKELGLMHCAFRYRGKANYRDALYLSYGQRNPAAGERFVEDLKVSAQAMALIAIVVLGRTHGPQTAKSFRDDLSLSLRGVSALPPEERFWEGVP